MQRLVLSAVVLVAALLVPVSPATATASGLSPTEDAFVAEINATRAAVGLPPLTVHVHLSNLSRGWAQTMAENGQLVHASPITAGFSDPWLSMGENIGYGYGVGSLMDAFRASAGHYANLVDPDYNYVGVGVAMNGNQIWTTHRFLESPTPPPPPPPPVTHTCEGETATIVGTAGADVLNGTSGRDVIVALGGADTIRGWGGNDLICAGGGNDEINGGPGADDIYGQGGSDRVFASGGKDFVHGGSGPDRLNGLLGKDRVWGGGGADRCWGEQMRCETKYRTLHNGTKLY